MIFIKDIDAVDDFLNMYETIMSQEKPTVLEGDVMTYGGVDYCLFQHGRINFSYDDRRFPTDYTISKSLFYHTTFYNMLQASNACLKNSLAIKSDIIGEHKYDKEALIENCKLYTTRILKNNIKSCVLNNCEIVNSNGINCSILNKCYYYPELTKIHDEDKIVITNNSFYNCIFMFPISTDMTTCKKVKISNNEFIDCVFVPIIGKKGYNDDKNKSIIIEHTQADNSDYCINILKKSNELQNSIISHNTININYEFSSSYERVAETICEDILEELEVERELKRYRRI